MNLDGLKPAMTLDTKGLSCPMPLLKAKKVMEKLAAGEVLEVLGTDPGSKNDFPGWCERAGHTFLGTREADGFFMFYIKKN